MLWSTKMKIVLYISILSITIIGCNADECKCSMSQDKITALNNSIEELEDVFGYEWKEKFTNTKHKTYILEIDNWFTNYMKTYKLVNDEDGPYLETRLSAKYIEKKVTKQKIIEQRRFELSLQQWNQFDQAIEHRCLWTEPINFEIDTNYADYLIYNIEGYNPNENSCTKNKYHMIKKQSRADPDIKEFITLLTNIEPMNDLDSMNKSTYPNK